MAYVGAGRCSDADCTGTVISNIVPLLALVDELTETGRQCFPILATAHISVSRAGKVF